MPYTIRKQKCKQSDGDAGSYVLSYTDKSGKKHSNCHTSKKKAQGQIAAIEGQWEADEMGAEEEVMTEELLREMVRELLSEKLSNYGLGNTVYSDLNEILMASALMGGTTISDVTSTVGSDAAATVRARVKMIKSAVLDSGGTQGDARARVQVEVNNAQNMAIAVKEWAASNGYGDVISVYWTARPGALQQAMKDAGESEVTATPGHPADVAVLFDNGQVLGVSAKATKGTADIAFKNPGWGTIARSLGLDINIPKNEIEKQLRTRIPDALDMSMSDRKQYLRASSKRKSEADAAGRLVLKKIRDEILVSLSSMSESQIRNFVLSNLMDAGGVIVPPYIKVTATGAGRSAHVTDPTDNPMIKMLRRRGLKPIARGDDSIVFVSSQGAPILQLRAKWESQMLASSVKLSAEPAAKSR